MQAQTFLVIVDRVSMAAESADLLLRHPRSQPADCISESSVHGLLSFGGANGDCALTLRSAFNDGGFEQLPSKNSKCEVFAKAAICKSELNNGWRSGFAVRSVAVW